MSRGELDQIVQLATAAAGQGRSDRDLLEHFVAQRDQTAFALLVQRHGPLVMGVCRRVLGDAHDAEDACQATFLILARKAGSVRWHASVRNWLYQVAFRVAREARARRSRRQEQEREAGTRPRADAVAELTWREVSAVLDEEMNRLPDRERAVLVLCYLDGKTRDEAAEQLGWSLNAVKKRLERGRDLLRRRLERRGLPLSAALLSTLLEQNATRAAVSSLMLVATVRAGMEFAAGEKLSIPTAVLSLAQGVLNTMVVIKLKMVAMLVLVLAVVGLGAGLALHHSRAGGGEEAALVPLEQGAQGKKLEPGQVAVSKPDKNGLVTMLRPLVTHLAPGDPLRIALHWETEKGPIPRYEGLGDGNHKTPVLRDATVGSMTFTITPPGGKQYSLRAKVDPAKQRNNLGLYFSPTYALTLTDKGVADEAGAQGTWTGEPKVALDTPGLWTIQVSGSLVRDKAEAIPFASGTIVVERGAGGLKTLAQVEAAAREALKQKFPEASFKNPLPVIEDKAGNRLLRYRSPLGFNIQEYAAEAKPDGTITGLTQRIISNCVARGTLVEGEQATLPIEKVREGDRIWGYDSVRQEKVLTTVRLMRRSMADETLVFGGTLRVTAAHPLFAGATWKLAGAVGPQELLLTSDLQTIPAGVPERLVEPIDVFDLTVDGPHTYFAGGILVHNKDRDYVPRLDDLWYQLWPVDPPRGN